jgi:peptide/nickel transport system substrate-binding protein
MRRLIALLVLSIVLAVAPSAGAAPAAPAGQMTWAAHITLAPTWFDPAETPGIGTPFMILYALHDALVKPMPGNPMAPSLAESWSLSKDGLAYEFVLRQGVRFHNGDPVTPEDVKSSTLSPQLRELARHDCGEHRVLCLRCVCRQESSQFRRRLG